MAIHPVSAAISSPSPFSTLLRCSKFASYDRKINQVYTTFGGDAHRGNWGLKRPLPLRRRKAYITVNAVDSHYQQTEWNSGETQARFVKKWEELNVDIRYLGESMWDRKLGASGKQEWFADSEFSPGSETMGGAPAIWNDILSQPHHRGPRTPAVPNIHAMSETEFQAYLKKLRKLRPKFKAYIEQQSNDDPRLRDKSLYQLAQSPSNHHTNFISAHAALPYHSLDSRAIEQIPHRSAGLTYAHVSPLQTAFTSKALPGIILHPSKGKDRAQRSSPNTYAASFAGMVATLPRNGAGNGEKALIELKSEHGVNKDTIEDSIAKLRLSKVPVLAKVPNVVGRNKEGLKAADIIANVVNEKQPEWKKSNPHTPGSMEYITMEENPVWAKAKPMHSGQWPYHTPRPVGEAMMASRRDGKALLNQLANIVQSDQETDEELDD